MGLSRNLESRNFYKNVFLGRNAGIHGQICVQAKGLSQLDKKIIAVLLTPILVFALSIILFTPVIPVQVTKTETRTRNLLFETEDHLTPYLTVDGSNVTDANGNTIYRTDYVNLTNSDVIEGNFSITLSKFHRNFEFRVGTT